LHKTTCSQLAQIFSLTILGISVRSLQLYFKVVIETLTPLMVAGDFHMFV